MLSVFLFASAWVVTSAQSTAGGTTRYWDCCKPACSASGEPGGSNPVNTCDIHDHPLGAGGAGAPSGCGSGGSAFMCSTEQPWAVDETLAYGFAARSASLSDFCCACYQYVVTESDVD